MIALLIGEMRMQSLYIIFLSLVTLMPLRLAAATFYVNSSTGNDLWDGTSPNFVSGSTGPMETVSGGISVAKDGDTLNISGDFVTEPIYNNKSLVFDLQNEMRFGDFYQDCSTGSSVIQGANLIISSALTFKDGIVKGLSEIRVYPGGIVGNLASTSYLEGFLYLGKANTIKQRMVFPVGDGGILRPLEWTVSQSSSDTNYYGVKLIKAEAPNLEYPSGINNKSYFYYWETKYEGSAVPADIKYCGNYSQQGLDDEVSDPDNLRLLYAKKSATTYTDLGGKGNSAATGKINGDQVASGTGYVSLGNAIGGQNKLGTYRPVLHFGLDNLCKGVLSQFADRSFISAGETLTDWSWEFGTSGTSDTSTLQNPSFAYFSEGQYKIRLAVTASNGYKDTFYRTIEIGDKPVVNFTTLGSCIGDSTSFTSSTSSNQNIISMQWRFGDGTVFADTIEGVKHLYSTPGKFDTRLIVTNATYCADSMDKEITIFAKPDPKINIEGLCTADSVLFKATGGVTGDSVVTWLWTYSSKSSNSQNFKDAFQSSELVRAKLQVISKAGCKDSTEETKQIWKSPVAKTFLDKSIAGNDSIQCLSINKFKMFDASIYPIDQTNTTQYLWGLGRDPDGNTHSFKQEGEQPVVLKIKTDKGCSDSTTLRYVVTALDTSSILIYPTCLRDSLKMVARLSAPLKAKLTAYSWSINGQQFNTLRDTFSIYAGDTGNYKLRFWANFSSGCSDTSTHSLYINPLPSVKKDTTRRMPFCPGETISLSIRGSDSITWSDGDTSHQKQFGKAGLYTFVIKDSKGCKTTDSFETVVFNKPAASTNRDTSVARGSQVLLLAKGGVFYNWFPTSLVESPDSANTLTKANVTTTYIVLVTDSNGCQARDTVTITWFDKAKEKIPNLITPNGDGKNDSWDLSSLDNISEAMIRVFDARGKMVFKQNKGYANNWAGTEANGTELARGSYLYIIERENRPTLKGFLKILR